MRKEAKLVRRKHSRQPTNSFLPRPRGVGKAGARRRAQTQFFGTTLNSKEANVGPDLRRDLKLDSQLKQHAKRLTSQLDTMSLIQLQEDQGIDPNDSLESISPNK